MTSSSTVRQSLRQEATFSRETLVIQYQQVRRQTEQLCRPLTVEDYGIQTITDVSPPKWHLAHVSWFFETFLLLPYCPGYRVFHLSFGYLFNSYYETHGQPYPRPQRGLLSRPTVAEVYQYRTHVDEAMVRLIMELDERCWGEFKSRVVLGLHHEQQHQELLCTDIKHILAFNPLKPIYRRAVTARSDAGEIRPLTWVEFAGGVKSIGHEGASFSFDNEIPRHPVYVQDYALASRLVTNGEYLTFMEAGGYQSPEYWLSDGWKTVQQQCWEAPLYWEKRDGRWWLMTLSGMRPVLADEPVCHVSFYEADAYARWAEKRLPTEVEWELAASRQPVMGNFCESDYLHPLPAGSGDVPLRQIFGDVWEWTQSPYTPYPGYRPLAGSLGEYNGKFMCSQIVLRGGSCATPLSHIRSTYRNFFYPGDRWQFSGIRLADDK